MHRKFARMDSHDLKGAIAEFGISQAEFASLIDVTPRAISLWISGERSIPGPVEAYLRILQLLPPHLLQIELSHRKRGLEMRDGIYIISYQYNQNWGVATLIFDYGQIYGIDVGAAKYDGGYTYDPSTRLVTATVKVTFPKNCSTVFSITHPFEWSIDIIAKFAPHSDAGDMLVETSLGQKLAAKFQFARPIPRAA